MKKTQLLSFIALIFISIASIGLLSFCLFSDGGKETTIIPDINNEIRFANASVDTGVSSADIGTKGGSIYVGSNVVADFNGSISNKTTHTYGGAVFIASGGTFNMTGGSITGCKADYGGAIYVSSGATLNITGGIISGCTAVYGGAVFVENGGIVNIDNASITENGALSGFAFYFNDNAEYTQGVNANIQDNYFVDITYKRPSGVYNYETKELLFSWADVISLGYITVNNGSLTTALKGATVADVGFPIELVVDESVTAIADQAFGELSLGGDSTGTEALYGIYLPSTIQYIGATAFGQCGLIDVVIDDAPVEIGDFAFAACQNMYNLDLGNNVRSFGDGMFLMCGLNNLEAIAAEQRELYICKDAIISELSMWHCGVSKFKVDPQNPYITDIDGILYTKDLSAIVQCPVFYQGEVNIPSGVQIVGATAFAACMFVAEELVLPEGLLQIGRTVPFGDVSITFPAFVDVILNQPAAFTKIRLPNSITTFNERTFENYSTLQEINIPTSLTSIPTECFMGCSSLSSELVFPSQVSEIGYQAFNGCTSIPSVEFLGNNVRIGNYAFNGCTGISGTLDLSAVSQVGELSFRNCSSIESLILENVTTVYNHAFYDCTSLNEVIFPTTTVSLGQSAFRNCPISGEISINASSIGLYCFQDCQQLETVNINGSSCFIDEQAFYGCSNLTTLNISGTLNSIGNSAFYGCSNLTGLLQLGNVTSIGTHAFDGCNITDLSIGSVDTIGDYAFYNNANMAGNISLTATTVGAYAFYNCSSLNSLSLGSNIRTIGDLAFYGCSKMTGILSIPTTLTSIGQSAFRNCSKLTGTPNFANVSNIGNYAFQACTGLTGVTLGTGVRTVGQLAFYGCSGITSLSILEGVTTLGASSFRNCSKISGTLVLPNSLTQIGNYAFHTASALTAVTFGSGINQIGDGVFANCTNVLSYDFSSVASVPTLTNANCFNGINANCKIYVRSSLLNSWKTATNWSARAEYITSA